MGIPSSDWIDFDKKRWSLECFWKYPLNRAEKKEYSFSLKEIQMFLLEHNFFFSNVDFFSASNSSVSLLRVVFHIPESTGEKYSLKMVHSFIYQILPRFPKYRILWEGDVPNDLPVFVQFRVYPLAPSKKRKFLQVIWPYHKGFSQKIERFPFQIQYEL